MNKKIIQHWKNKSLVNIREIIDGILYVEEWKDIEGYEGLYQVSSFGRVKSMNRFIKRKSKFGVSFNKLCNARILSQTILKSGYLKLSIYCDGIPKTTTVHILVAKAFINNKDNKPEVNHLFGIKTDNRFVRLEWATSSENAQHKVDMGLWIPPWTGITGKNHHSSKPVSQFDKQGNLIKKWDSVTEAAVGIGVNIRTTWISACCLGIEKKVKGKWYKVKYAYGFIWKYD